MGAESVASTLQSDPHSACATVDLFAETLSGLNTVGLHAEAETRDLHDEFLRFGYARIRGFLSGAALAMFRDEMGRLETISIRRRFDMPGYETPRRLSVLGGGTIRRESPALAALYHHHAIRGAVERIVGRPIYSCRHPEEFMVANFLQHAGDTHGWHLDDPGIALVIFAESPGPAAGGDAEMIANWRDLCRRHGHPVDGDVAELVAWANTNKMIDRYRHDVGDAYLLRADLNLHRVTPLNGPSAKRSVLNLAFELSRHGTYGTTASLLYGREAAGAA